MRDALPIVGTLVTPNPAHAALQNVSVIWRSGSNGPCGQFGARIAFSPDGKYLFLSSGERQRFSPAQDSEQLLGKILRLTLDGKAAPGNPMYDAGGVRAMTRSEEHTSELQSLMRISYAAFCLKKKKYKIKYTTINT